MPLVDTNIAIQLRDGDERTIERLDVARDDLVLSLVSLIELEGGVATASPSITQRRRDGITRLLARARIAPLDQRVVDAYASVIAHTGFSRRKILDRLIAATALVHDLMLVTTNGDDFHDIPDLRLEVWPAAQ